MKSEKDFSTDARVFCHEDTKFHKELMHWDLRSWLKNPQGLVRGIF